MPFNRKKAKSSRRNPPPGNPAGKKYKIKIINPAFAADDERGAITHIVNVSFPQRESEDPRQDVPQLIKLSKGTGVGDETLYYSLDEFEQVFSQKDAVTALFPYQGQSQPGDKRITTLWDIKNVMFLLVALLSVEWLTRKLLKLA